VRAPADGYTLLMANEVNAINTSLYERLGYDFIRDMAPVARIADAPLFMVLPRREFLHLTAGAATLPFVSRIARAQTYPTRPVRIIVAAAAGGPTGTLRRLAICSVS
jgi:tripartite-type tricarboxylate transporter receptor subunit TctC